MTAGLIADASAILALLMAEPFRGFMPERLQGAAVGAVNLCEIVARLLDIGMPAETTAQTVARLDLRIWPFDEGLAHRAALLRAATRHAGLSLGDRACLALGLQLGIPVVTADRAWAGLDIGVEVILIR